MCIVKVVPTPTVLRSPIEPPISLASCEQILRPRPVPPNFLLKPRSPCTNGSKIFSCMCSAIPGPVSSTSNSKMYDLAFGGGGVGDLSRMWTCGVALSSKGFIASAVPPLGATFAMLLDCAEMVDPDPTLCLLRPALSEFRLEKDDVLLSSLGVSTSLTHRILSSTFPPAGVNFKLLLTRLIMTCNMRCWSPQRHMSLSLPVPNGPSAGNLGRSRLCLSGLVLSMLSVPTKLTVNLILFSRTCLSKMEMICDLISPNLNSLSSRFTCCPIWFLEKLRRSSRRWRSRSPAAR